MKKNQLLPLEPRKLNFKVLMLIIAAYAAILVMQGCGTIRDGCHERRGMVGYGYKYKR